jgi:hypothetical protein
MNVMSVCLPVARYTLEFHRISIVLSRCPDVYKKYSMLKLLFIFLLLTLIMKFLFALLLSVLGLVTECIKIMYSVLTDAGLPNCVTINRTLNLGINFHCS